MAPNSRYHEHASNGSYSHHPHHPHHHGDEHGLPSAWDQTVGAGPSSAPLQRLSPAGQRPLPNHYFPYYEGSTDYYVNAHQSVPPPWPANYLRQSAHAWGPPVGDSDSSVALRSTVPCDNAVVAPVPHLAAPMQQQQQQQTSNTAHNVQMLAPQPDMYQAGQRLNELRISEYSTPPHAPPYPDQVHRAPVDRLLNPPEQAALQGNPAQLSLQPPASWESGSAVHLPTGDAHHAYSHANNASLPGQPWDESQPSAVVSTAPVYAQMPAIASQWTLHQQPDARGYLTEMPPQGTIITAPAREARRGAARKKSARVPSAFIQRQEKSKISRRRGPLDPDKRKMTHKMRKAFSVCIRCRFYKAGCDDGETCQRCIKTEGNARSFLEPCFRDHIEEASVVRQCSGRCNQEVAEFLGYDWIQGSDLYEMEIIWNLPGHGSLPGPPMRIHLRPFNPRRPILDTATSVWRNTDGEIQVVHQPAYAVYDTAQLIPTFERYLFSAQETIEQWIFFRIRHDEVAYRTYREVIRMRALMPREHGKPNLLDLAMRLQCISVASQGFGSVGAHNVPGIKEVDYRQFGRSSYEAYNRNGRDRPLPGSATHQFDVAALKCLKKLEKECLKLLGQEIFKPRIKPWYQLFLTLFVLIWNLEFIYDGAEGYILSKNGTMIENQVSNVVRTQIKKWAHSFDVLLAHWRCTLRTFAPFKLARENPEELRSNSHIDAEAFEYIVAIANIFDRTGPDSFLPPITGSAAQQKSSRASRWIMKLFTDSGI